MKMDITKLNENKQILYLLRKNDMKQGRSMLLFYFFGGLLFSIFAVICLGIPTDPRIFATYLGLLLGIGILCDFCNILGMIKKRKELNAEFFKTVPKDK